MSKPLIVSLAMVVLSLGCEVSAPAADIGAGQEGETQQQRDARMGWWRNAKFGLVHSLGRLFRAGRRLPRDDRLPTPANG